MHCSVLFQLEAFLSTLYSHSSTGINSHLIFVLVLVCSEQPTFLEKVFLKWPSTIAAAVSRKVEKVTSILVHGEWCAQTVASPLLLLLKV